MSEPLVFVAGATGHTGREVVAQLRARGVRTAAHVRADSARGDHWRDTFEALGAEVDRTPWDEDAMAATLERLGPTVVLALLGTTSKRSKATGGEDTYERVDFALTALLIAAVARAAPEARFVYLSAVGARAGQTRGYLGVRARIEAMLQSGPLDWVIARPSFIVGEREEPRGMEELGASALDGVAGLARRLGARGFADRYRSVSNVQLAAAMVNAGLDPDGAKQVLEGAALQ